MVKNASSYNIYSVAEATNLTFTLITNINLSTLIKMTERFLLGKKKEPQYL